MLHAGYDEKTVAEMGGWKDAQTVLRTYAHAITDRTVTNVLFGTPAPQRAGGDHLTFDNQRRKKI